MSILSGTALIHFLIDSDNNYITGFIYVCSNVYSKMLAVMHE